jgi:SAM-dependent methyltransferase
VDAGQSPAGLGQQVPGLSGRASDGGSVDEATVEGFGYEWTRFDQSAADPDELAELFRQYFASFPWDALPPDPVGFDLGCGSGRWARLAADRVGTLVGVDASAQALGVARRNAPTSPVVQAVAGALPLRPGAFDFGYSLGVLHHIPDPHRGLADAVTALKPGAPFLVYLYYAFDNRGPWFRAVWRASDLARRAVSRCPGPVRAGISDALAVAVYLPLARLAAAAERRGRAVDAFPLSAYRHRSLYAMRTDALDRFGTRLEHRFTRPEVAQLMERAGLERVTVSDDAPYWCAVGFKPASA